MSALTDLINQVSDKTLRDRLMDEANRLARSKKFGLVFENHIPECVPLYDAPVQIDTLVASKSGSLSDVYRVLSLNGDIAECVHTVSHDTASFAVKELVTVARFGDPVYSYLQILMKLMALQKLRILTS